MSRREGSLSPDYFEGLYAADPDPWQFATSPYERDKYAATLAALPRERYARALEVGCAIGVFTHALSDRCESLLALDVAETALAQARSRCADRPGVRFDRMRVPGDWPDGLFDLIVLSEVVYYLDRADIGRLAERVQAGLAPQGDIVLVHWTGDTDYPLSGDTAAEAFLADAASFTRPPRRVRAEAYRLDVLTRGPN